MANNQHTQRLHRAIEKDNGCKFWNEWRKASPNLGINLSAANLSGLNLDGIDLSRADLGNTDMTDSSFQKANFRFADLTGSYLNRGKGMKADFRRAHLNQVYLNDTDLTEVWFHKADLIEASFKGANLTKANFKDTYVREANFDRANLTQASLEGAYLRGSKMREANLSGANLQGADLRNVDLSHANLTNADLKGAKLRDASLREADLSGADLTGANLFQVDISLAKINDANLEGVLLYGVVGEFSDAKNIHCQKLEVGAQSGKHTLVCTNQQEIDELSLYLTDPTKHVRDLYIQKVRRSRNPLLQIESIAAPKEEYKIGQKIGAGLTGIVYEAQRIKDDLPVVLKIFDPDSDLIEEREWRSLQKRVILESIQAERFQHPNIVEIQEIGLWDFRPLLLTKDELVRPLIIMEYVRGITLPELLEEEISWETICSLMIQITQGLCHIHEFPRLGIEIIEDEAIRQELLKRRGTFHKNLTPWNIFVTQENETNLIVKIADPWGICYHDLKSTVSAEDSEKLHSSSQPSHILQYLAPEETEPENISPKSDIYMLGLIFYYMLTRVQFSNNWVLQRTDEFFILLDQSVCPNEMKNLILVMTELEPERRPTAREVLEFLQNLPPME